MGHWSQYRHRGRGAAAGSLVAPPGATQWTMDGDASPRLTFSPIAGDSEPFKALMEFQYWATGFDSGPTLDGSAPVGDVAQTGNLAAGLYFGQARWTDDDGNPTSGWSTSKSATV